MISVYCSELLYIEFYKIAKLRFLDGTSKKTPNLSAVDNARYSVRKPCSHLVEFLKCVQFFVSNPFPM